MAAPTAAPTDAQQAWLLEQAMGPDKAKPVVMLNILRFKDVAAYNQYSEGVVKILDRIGAKILWTGTIDALVIGDEARLGGEHHMVALVRYPSREAVFGMFTSDEYQRIHHYRLSGLHSQWLVACSEVMSTLGSAASKL